jgi:hypothetical protein
LCLLTLFELYFYHTNIKKSAESVFLFLVNYLYLLFYFYANPQKGKREDGNQTANEGKTTTEIAKEVHISLKDKQGYSKNLLMKVLPKKKRKKRRSKSD